MKASLGSEKNRKRNLSKFSPSNHLDGKAFLNTWKHLQVGWIQVR